MPTNIADNPLNERNLEDFSIRFFISLNVLITSLFSIFFCDNKVLCFAKLYKKIVKTNFYLFFYLRKELEKSISYRIFLQNKKTVRISNSLYLSLQKKQDHFSVLLLVGKTHLSVTVFLKRKFSSPIMKDNHCHAKIR